MTICLSDLNLLGSSNGLVSGFAWSEPINVGLGPYASHFVTISEPLKAGSTFLKIGVKRIIVYLWNRTYATGPTNFGIEFDIIIRVEGSPDTDWIKFGRTDTSRVGGFGEDRFHVASYEPVGGITVDKEASFIFRTRYFNSFGRNASYVQAQTFMIHTELTV